jgi:hypothetical protein
MYKTEVTRGTYAAGAGKFDTTTANAFTGCADLSAYQDGKHLLWASDGTNSLWARISATAPGGLTLDSELATNGDFSAWADPSVPDSWGKTGTHNATNYVAENANGMRLVSDGTLVGINRTPLIAGALYKAESVIHSVSSGSIYVDIGTVTPDLGKLHSAPGSLSWYYVPHNTEIRVRRTGACDVIITSLSVKRVTDIAATGALLLGSTGARGYINLSASFNGNLAGSYRIYTTKKYRSI